MSLFLPLTNFPQNLSHCFNISWREELVYQAEERDEKMEKNKQSWLEAGSSKHICKSQRGQTKSIAQSPALETQPHQYQLRQENLRQNLYCYFPPVPLLELKCQAVLCSSPISTYI